MKELANIKVQPTKGARLKAAVDVLCRQAGTDTAETVDWLCGEHGGLAKLFAFYFGGETFETRVAADKDADRYRMLRNGSNWPAVFSASDEWEPLRGDELDKAVDKEMTK